MLFAIGVVAIGVGPIQPKEKQGHFAKNGGFLFLNVLIRPDPWHKITTEAMVAEILKEEPPMPGGDMGGMM